MTTLQYTRELIVTDCWCGMAHAVPKVLYDQMERAHADGKQQTGIYCPLGHVWTFAGKGKAQIEREARERAERWLANREEDLRAERASHANTRGQLTKAKKRTANGVCPCCQRSFTQLTRHMRTKHPDYTTEANEATT